MAQRLKHLPAMWETQVWSLGREDPLEKEMATHSSLLAWRIPWTEEPGGLHSTGLQRVGHDWATSLSLSPSKLNMDSTKFLSKSHLYFFFAEIDKLILKFICKFKVHRITKTILKTNNKVGRFILFDFKAYYKATTIKTVWWWQDRYTDQWKRI